MMNVLLGFKLNVGDITLELSDYFFSISSSEFGVSVQHISRDYDNLYC